MDVAGRLELAAESWRRNTSAASAGFVYDLKYAAAKETDFVIKKKFERGRSAALLKKAVGAGLRILGLRRPPWIWVTAIDALSAEKF